MLIIMGGGGGGVVTKKCVIDMPVFEHYTLYHYYETCYMRTGITNDNGS